MARIAVAVSGGADSLFALVSLMEQGHDVIAMHGLFLAENISHPTTKLEEVCFALQVPLHIIDMRKQFDQLVIEPFIKSYAHGLTPNPCAICNKQIKFGLLLQEAIRLNADLLATGHYAAKNLGLSPLAKGKDQRKEQSYFLSLVPKHSFERCIFPLENKEKTFIFHYLQERGFNIPVEKESQEICFVPSDAYRPFLESEAQKRQIALSGAGPILLEQNGTYITLGQHKGLWQYTEGQRRGLNIAYSEPLYVRTKDNVNNTLILGTAAQLKLQGCVINNLNILAPVEQWPNDIFVRVRYRQQEARANVTLLENTLRIEFENPQSLTACGQIAALYDATGQVLAGGIIHSIF